ncbi:MAG: T9SS C-terminal target domain-containing protein [Balneola sp.]|nr:MAG: T9SS C-terminal target domain-containing protein [Balneola sp.]
MVSKRKVKFIGVLFLLLSSISVEAQEYATRTFYGQKLEPINGIMHGAGQDPGIHGGYRQSFFDDYVSEMDSSELPMIYMYYESISGIEEGWADELRKKLLKYGDRLIALQFGVYLVNQEHLVPSALLDNELDIWLDGLEELGLPVYARIGYEFNGPWNDYSSVHYINSFKYITDKLREREKIEAATVWNLAVEGYQNYMDYYPGDEYVDWWSINYFSKDDVNLSLSDDFLADAHEHGKPVIIGESTPRYIGVTDGQDDWDEWFVPFFNHVAIQPGIKMTGYINWEWADQSIEPVWNTWGDARLASNQVVAQNYRDEMNDSLYLHLGSDRVFREALGHTETDLPGTVTNLRIESTRYPVRLSWDESSDTSGIARYLLYNGEEFYSFTGNTSYEFRELSFGDSLNISVIAVDRAGNRSVLSEPILIKEDTESVSDDLIENSEFDDQDSFWNFNRAAGSFTTVEFSIDTNSVISGKYSALTDVTRSSSVNFHIMIEQETELVPGHSYQVRYKAKASGVTEMETWVQETTGNFYYLDEPVSLSQQVQSYAHSFSVPQSHDTETSTFLRFMMGISGTNKVWIDEVSVFDLGITVNNERNTELPAATELYQNYPNPFNPTTKISYSLSLPTLVSLTVYNVQGVEVAKLVEEPKLQGSHTLVFDASNLSSGVYFYRLKAGSETITRKMLLIK